MKSSQAKIVNKYFSTRDEYILVKNTSKYCSGIIVDHVHAIVFSKVHPKNNSNINNVYFDIMVSQNYSSELQLNKAYTSDTEATFLDLHLSISNDIVSSKIYDKRDNSEFEIVNFQFLDDDVPRSTSYGVYISQLIRFARASSHVADFNTHNKFLTQKRLK